MTEKKIIAVDIDDVLAANAKGFTDFSNKRWGTNLKPEDYHDHWALLWGLDHKETVERADVYANEGVFKDYAHFEDALPVLKKISKKYKLIVVTARRVVAEKDTRDWIEQYFSNIFHEIYFAGIFDEVTDHFYQKTKGELIKELGASYLIDDQLKHCISAGEIGLEAVLFGNYSWNQAKSLPNNIYRASNWQQVSEYFDAR